MIGNSVAGKYQEAAYEAQNAQAEAARQMQRSAKINAGYDRLKSIEAGRDGLTAQQVATLQQRATDNGMQLDDLLLAKGNERLYGYAPADTRFDADPSYQLAANHDITHFAGMPLGQIEAEAIKYNTIFAGKMHTYFDALDRSFSPIIKRFRALAAATEIELGFTMGYKYGYKMANTELSGASQVHLSPRMTATEDRQGIVLGAEAGVKLKSGPAELSYYLINQEGLIRPQDGTFNWTEYSTFSGTATLYDSKINDYSFEHEVSLTPIRLKVSFDANVYMETLNE